jgi:ribosomal protein S14
MNIIEEYLNKKSSEDFNKELKSINKLNSRCQHCGSKDLIKVFAQVKGDIGRYSGTISTERVKKCKECGNEETILKPVYNSPREIFNNEFVDPAYFSQKFGQKSTFKSISSIYLDNIKDTKTYLASLPLLDYREEIVNNWYPEVWERFGFKIPKITKKFLWIKTEVYPTWKHILNN